MLSHYLGPSEIAGIAGNHGTAADIQLSREASLARFVPIDGLRPQLESSTIWRMSSHERRTAPHLAYEHVVCDNCERNVNAAFDILFDAMLKRREAPVENLITADRLES